MDVMSYSYKTGNNQLDKVVDAAADATTDYANYNDIKQGQQNANYEYDFIGNLIRDKSADLYDPNDPQKKMIEWNVYGKISKITKITAGQTTNILYTYDAGGNRITKTVNGKTTWYVRDASGNVMSSYESGGVNAGALTQTELHMYGSSRLGINNVNNNMASNSTTSTFTRGNKLYELTNHLGNVLVTVSDKKIGVDAAPADGIIDYYNADVVTANDYYPGGMQMPGRKYTQPNSSYRYGFNGKEKDNSTGEENFDFGARIYDSKIGRWLSLDPLQKKYPFATPYNFSGNNPVKFVDLDGKDIIGFEEMAKDKTWGMAIKTIQSSNVAMDFLRKFVDINNGNKLGATKSGEFADVNVKFEFAPSIPDASGSTGTYYNGVNILLMKQSDLLKIDPKKLEIKVQLSLEMDSKSSSGERVLTITHETALHVDYMATLVQRMKNDKTYTIQNLQQDLQKSVNNEKGTPHWQIQPGTNTNFENINQDVSKVLKTNMGLNEYAPFTFAQNEQKPSEQKAKIDGIIGDARKNRQQNTGNGLTLDWENSAVSREHRIPTSLQFEQAIRSEKDWTYNQNCTESQKANPLSECGGGLKTP